MQLISPARALNVCLFAALCFCLGCGQDATGTISGNGVSPEENASSLVVDADLSAGQLLSLAEEKLDAEQYDEAINLFKYIQARESGSIAPERPVARSLRCYLNTDRPVMSNAMRLKQPSKQGEGGPNGVGT